MTRIGWLVGAVTCSLALGACGVNEENYGPKLAKAYCKYSYECGRAYHLSEWDDVAECTDDYIDDNEDYYEDLIDDCDFDADKANDCLKSLREATGSCDPDDIEFDDCSEVWDC